MSVQPLKQPMCQHKLKKTTQVKIFSLEIASAAGPFLFQPCLTWGELIPMLRL